MTVIATDEHLERLLEELEQRSQAEIEQLRSEARAAIDTVRRDSASRVADREKAAVAACESDAARRRGESIAIARGKARADLLEAQHALVERVFSRSREDIDARFAERCQLPTLVGRVVDLLTYADAEGTSITARPELAVAMRASFKDVAITEDAAVDWGVVVTTAENRLTMKDTVGAWLDQQRPTLAMQICHELETLA